MRDGLLVEIRQILEGKQTKIGASVDDKGIDCTVMSLCSRA